MSFLLWLQNWAMLRLSHQMMLQRIDVSTEGMDNSPVRFLFANSWQDQSIESGGIVCLDWHHPLVGQAGTRNQIPIGGQTHAERICLCLQLPAGMVERPIQNEIISEELGAEIDGRGINRLDDRNASVDQKVVDPAQSSVQHWK